MSSILKKSLIISAIFLSFLFYDNNKFAIQRVITMNYYRLYANLLPITTNKDQWVELAVPFHRQEHALSCEVATLKMILDFYGHNISENELLAKLTFSTKAPRSPENIWADADTGFVGNIDGKMPNTGYGVYEEELARLASQYREARALKGATLEDILASISRGVPVIVWGHIASGRDISWQTSDGDTEKAVYGEHTRVLIGFKGTTSNPSHLILLDPVYGKIIFSKNKFIKNWASLDNRALLVY